MKARPHLVLAVVAGIVLVLAIATALLASQRERPELDRSTPEGTAQLFVLAVLEDRADAVSYLDPSLGCEAPFNDPYLPRNVSLSVAGVRVDGDEATVELDVSERSGPIFGGYNHREQFVLALRDEGWLLTQVPWPIYHCG